MANRRGILSSTNKTRFNALKFLEIQSRICIYGKKMQDLIRKDGTLRECKKMFTMCQGGKKTYMAVSPCFVNFFWSCVSSPRNYKNQNELRSLIPELVKALNYLKTKTKMRKHIREHWLLLDGLLKRNRRNVKCFTKNGGEQLIKEYLEHPGIKKCLTAIQRSVQEFTHAPVKSSHVDDDTHVNTDQQEKPVNSTSEEIINSIDEVNSQTQLDPVIPNVKEFTDKYSPREEEVILDSSADEKEPASGEEGRKDDTDAKKQAAMEELNRIIARTNLRREERSLRLSLEAKKSSYVLNSSVEVPSSPVADGAKSTVKTFVNILKRLSWSKE